MMYQTQTASQLDTGRDVPFENFMGLAATCDDCGAYSIKMHRTDDSVNLCPSCHTHYGSLPSSMKQSIEKWFMGNVL